MTNLDLLTDEEKAIALDIMARNPDACDAIRSIKNLPEANLIRITRALFNLTLQEAVAIISKCLDVNNDKSDRYL